MADERAGAPEPPKGVANENRIQTGGRQANAAQPLNAADDHGGPERYPQVNRTDVVQGERRSFDPGGAAHDLGDEAPDFAADRRLGPGGDPAEGKR